MRRSLHDFKQYKLIVKSRIFIARVLCFLKVLFKKRQTSLIRFREKSFDRLTRSCNEAVTLFKLNVNRN